MYKLCYLYSVINSYLVLHFLLMNFWLVMCRLRPEAGSRPCRAVGSLSRQSRHLGFWRLTAQASYFLSLSRGSGRRLWVVYKSNYYHYFKHFFRHFLRFFYAFECLFTKFGFICTQQTTTTTDDKRRPRLTTTTNDGYNKRRRDELEKDGNKWRVQRVGRTWRWVQRMRTTTKAQDTSFWRVLGHWYVHLIFY